MGLPQDMRDTFVSWAMQLLHSNSREAMGEAMQKITAYLKQAIAEKKANPDDGVVSLIAHAAPDGVPMSDTEIFGFVCFLFIGGLATCSAHINKIWPTLARNTTKTPAI